MTALSCILGAPSTRASDCLASSAQPTTPRRIPTLREAQHFAWSKAYENARALYLWVLARTPDDTEAVSGLARVDAWDGCWSLAEREFRGALSVHPEDADARSGLVDLYMWEKRWEDAQHLLDEGLVLDPDSGTLLLRRARLLHWSSNDSEAIEIVRGLGRAGKEAADDPELQALRDEIVLGEASVGLRFDAYPSGYPSITTVDGQLVQHWRKFEFGLGEHLVDWAGGGLASPIVDGERTVRVGYHPAPGYAMTVEAGFGNPGVVLPRGEASAEFAFPIYGRVAGVLDYAFWDFTGGVAVNIVNPTIAYEASDDLELAAHAWIVHVGVGPTGSGGWADTWGAHAGWKATPRLRLVLYYTYGVQLDRDPTVTELLTLRSHVVTVSADWLVTHDWGVRGLLGIERRDEEGVPPIVIPSLGASFYVRW